MQPRVLGICRSKLDFLVSAFRVAARAGPNVYWHRGAHWGVRTRLRLCARAYHTTHVFRYTYAKIAVVSLDDLHASTRVLDTEVLGFLFAPS
eukprot:6204521-Pleurochrysis_carterae.AAC.3